MSYIDDQKAILATLKAAQDKASLEMMRKYKVVTDDLRAQLMKLQEAGIETIDELTRMDRIRALETKLVEETTKIVNEYKVQLNALMEKQYLDTYYKMAFAASKSLGVFVNIALVDAGQIKAALTHKFDDGNLNATLTDLSANSIDLIKETMAQGIASGQGIATLSRNLSDAINQTANRSEKILRTELSRIAEDAKQAQMQSFREQGVKTRLRYVAVLDNRTRRQSAQMDGQLSNEKGQFKYPDGNWYFPGHSKAEWDINDRCTTIQVLESEIEGESLPKDYTFNDWATDIGLTKNVYGEKIL